MYKQICKVIINGIPSEKEITYYNMDDIANDSDMFRVMHEQDSYMELGPCPICGWMTTLNESAFGHYAWCSLCGFEGPKHNNPYIAAKVFVDKSFKTLVKLFKFNPEHLKDLDSSKFTNKSRVDYEEFISSKNNN